MQRCEIENPSRYFSDACTRPNGFVFNLDTWMNLLMGCVAGALGDYENVAKLAKAGFNDIDIEPTRVYGIEDARGFLSAQGLDVEALARAVGDKFVSAFVHATKPSAA